MMTAIVLIFTNLLVIPPVTLILLAWLPPSSVQTFRVIALAVLAACNIGVIRFLRRPLVVPGVRSIKAAALLAFAIAAGVILFRIYLEPYGMWDAWAMWNAKSRQLATAFLEGYPFELVRNDWSHPGYPPTLPLVLAFASVMAGGWSTLIPVLGLFTFLILYFLIATVLLSCARTWSVFLIYVATAAVLLPSLLRLASDQCADFPTAVVFGLTVFFHCCRDQAADARSRFWLSFLGGLAAAFTGCIKNEGMILMAVWLVFVQLHDRGNAASLLGAAVPFILLLAYKLHAPEFSPVKVDPALMLQKFLDPARYGPVIRAVLTFHSLGLLFVPIVVVAVFLKRRYHSLLPYLPLLAAHMVFGMIFVITSEDQVWHIGTALMRVHLQIVPAFFVASIHIYVRNQESPSVPAASP